MALNLKELSQKEVLFTGGHRLCPGCGASIAVRQALLAAQDLNVPVVVVCATGCLEVASTIFPYTAWRVPWFHNAFENAAATISGIEACFRVFKRKNKIKEDIKFIAFGGDGGTYDIGLQALSGAIERRHNFLYICYNNEAYMNTGIQRSSATPGYAHTTTAPVGKVKKGKEQFRKNLTEIVVAHNIPYAAQATPGYWRDYMQKVRKALSTEGPSFINVWSPCPRGWGSEAEKTIALSRLAVQTKFWNLYEVENGKYKINVRPSTNIPLTEFLQQQARYKHLLLPENKELLVNLEKQLDDEWKRLEMMEKCTNATSNS